MPAKFTETEIAEFLAQLDGFRGALAPRQQVILDTLLEAAASGPGFITEEGEVEGFAVRSDRRKLVEETKDLSEETQRVARLLLQLSVAP